MDRLKIRSGVQIGPSIKRPHKFIVATLVAESLLIKHNRVVIILHVPSWKVSWSTAVNHGPTSPDLKPEWTQIHRSMDSEPLRSLCLDWDPLHQAMNTIAQWSLLIRGGGWTTGIHLRSGCAFQETLLVSKTSCYIALWLWKGLKSPIIPLIGSRWKPVKNSW